MLLYVYVFTCSEVNWSVFNFVFTQIENPKFRVCLKVPSTNLEVLQDPQMSHQSSAWTFMFPNFSPQGVGGWVWSNFIWTKFLIPDPPQPCRNFRAVFLTGSILVISLDLHPGFALQLQLQVPYWRFPCTLFIRDLALLLQLQVEINHEDHD